MNFDKLSKNKKLAFSILFDAIGMITFIDIIWAPVSAYLMTKMYKGRKGKIWGAISFVEEIIPGFDIIPTFTIMWFYNYVYLANKMTQAQPQIIEIDK